MSANNRKKLTSPGEGGPDGLVPVIRELLEKLGEDPDREGLQATPKRVAEMWRFFTQGYDQDVAALFSSPIVDDRHQGTVLVRDIDFYSLCEHHLVPFFGNCHIAYVPDRKIVGLSKIARVVDVYSRRLQVQERLTNQVADALEEHLQPRGVAVLIEARHLCMTMRGVEKHNAVVSTSVLKGVFEKYPANRSEFFSQLGGFGNNG